MTTRRVYALIPVHNAENTVVDSVRSVLGENSGGTQTKGVNNAIVVLNNCTDGTDDLVDKHFWGEGRVTILEESVPGLVPALNRGLVHVLSQNFAPDTEVWVARQDADDLWEPEKLKKQLEFLDQHPEVDILGTQIQSMDKNGKDLSNGPPHPLDDFQIKAALLNGHNVIAHPSVMFRANILKYTGLYDDVFPMAEDLHLWLKASLRSTFANLPERLVRYRQVHNPKYNPVSPQVAGYVYQTILKNGLGKR